MSQLEKLIYNSENFLLNPWGGMEFKEYMSKIAPVCNYNPLSMFSAQIGQCISEPIDALLDREPGWKLLAFPLLPVAVGLVCLEIGIDLFTRPRTAFRKVRNLVDLARYHNVPGPKKNLDVLWSIEAEAVRHCPNAEDMFELYGLTMTLEDDFRDYHHDPPGKNIFSLPYEETQAWFDEQGITEKHERIFYGCPDCEDCSVHAFLSGVLLENPKNKHRRYWHTLMN